MAKHFEADNRQHQAIEHVHGPMLVIAGVLDTQVPIEDEYLLLSKGDVPKEAWINPKGSHLGRQVGVWPDPLIFKQVIIPWLVKTLQAPVPEATK